MTTRGDSPHPHVLFTLPSWAAAPGDWIALLSPFALIAENHIAVDRAVASWSILAAGLLFACVILYFKWVQGQRSIEQRDHMRALFALTERILAASDREEILRESSKVGAETTETTHCSVLLAHPSGTAISYVTGTAELPRAPLSMGAISGAVACFRSRETTEVPDAANCPFVDKETVRRRNQKAILYTPILAGSNCLGVLEFEDRKKRRTFTPEQRARAEHLARLVGIGIRMSDQRALTEQIHRSEKLSAVSELAQALWQELSDPFEQVLSLSTRVPFGVPTRELEERLHNIAQLVDGASSAVEKLVRFAQPSSGSEEEIDLNALLRATVADFRRRREGKDLQVKLGLSKRAPLILADPTHLQQVFQILLRHARHYLDSLGGKSLQINTTLRDRRVLVSIAPLARPDQPLRSSLASGKGELDSSSLGLSVCSSLIERAGGALQIDRQSSFGFQIEVEYPLTDDPFQVKASDSGQPEQPVVRAGSVTALIIDPDPEVQRKLVSLLSDQSYRAIPVSTGEEGVDLCQRMRFEWVFCDFRLQPMSAVEVWEKIRNRCERFIFLAEEGTNGQSPELFTGDGRAVLRKPFTQEDVEATIESLLRTSVIFQDG